MSLGSHHRSRAKANVAKTVDDFIEGANAIVKSKEAEKKPSQEDILLSFSGRIDRENECEKKPVLLYLKKDIALDIENYCHGNKQGIMNYLIRRGLDQLIQDNKLQLVMEN
ncbi:TPA: hypothetical protein QH041_003091 [Legionella pneumophila]|nr:hypothetical protein [Legionella pneumophila]HCU5995153.1 hypothetical protein [Legionella pneumophila]HDS3856722.1 hypothetical protein [Legionella pneumophila]HDS3863200.1 hypothetical protein [Legionella pneumophila]